MEDFLIGDYPALNAAVLTEPINSRMVADPEVGCGASLRVASRPERISPRGCRDARDKPLGSRAFEIG